MALPGFLARLLALVRRASRAVYRVMTIVLLAVVYVVLLPPFAIAFRLRRAPPRGFRLRDDPEVGSLARLRARF